MTATTHRWVAGGMSEVGERLVACSRCGMRRHWLGARDECAAAESRVADAVDVSTATTIELRWRGPYRREAARPCRRCGTLFVRPLAMNVAHFCGPSCAREHKLARISARVAAHAQRQRTDAR